ncbi:MAG: hypothetical protein WCT12_25710 [Verrucomicrobiota bacterium]
MRNQFRISTSTWLTFFSLGFLIGLFIFRRGYRQFAWQYTGPVPPIIPPPLPLRPPLPRPKLELPEWHWN